MPSGFDCLFVSLPPALALSLLRRGNEKSHLKSVRVTEQAGRSAPRARGRGGWGGARGAMRHRNPGLRLRSSVRFRLLVSTDSNGGGSGSMETYGLGAYLRRAIQEEEEFNLCKTRQRDHFKTAPLTSMHLLS